MSFKPREAATNKQKTNPIWRGIGCLMIFVVFGGGYFGADFLLWWVNPSFNGKNYQALSPALQNLVNATGAAPYAPYSVSIGLALIVALLFFGLITMGWAFVRGNAGREQEVRLSDVAKMYGKKNRKIRKCR